MNKLSVIIPVYNENLDVLQKILSIIYPDVDEIIVVDDGSDNPVRGTEHFRIIRHPLNKGYGAALKTGMRHAKNEYIGIIDADTQYDPAELVDMWKSFTDEDMLIGRRVTHEGGWRRVLGRFGMNTLSSLATLSLVKDVNSGMRIFKKSIAKSFVSILCDEFSFTASLTLSMILDGYRVRWVPIGYFPRKGAKSTVRILRHGLITLYQILIITCALRTRRLRKWLRETPKN